jgi:hypothetical protein
MSVEMRVLSSETEAEAVSRCGELYYEALSGYVGIEV